MEPIPVAPPPAAGGYWRGKRERGEALGAAVASALSERPADVVVTALHAAPATIAAARAAGRPSVLQLHSYESLCKYAFDAGSACRPASGCAACPRAASLQPPERRELLRARKAQGRALVQADRLIAPSRAVADACAAWCGRRPAIVPGATAAPEPLEARPDGPVLLAAARWSTNKGLALLEPLARALGPRRLAVTERGLPGEMRVELARLEHVDVVPNAPVGALLAAAGTLLVPSQWPEPFGRLAFEGLAAGVPTLAARVGGLAEFVPSDQLVAPPDSVPAWVSAIDELDDPDRRRAARRAGIAAARRTVAVPPAGRLEAVLRDTAEHRVASAE